MKILHVIPSVGPLRGGPSFVIRTMARGLAERGVETHVATTDDNGAFRLDVPLGRPVVEDGVVYWYFPRQTSFYLCSVPFTKWLWGHAGDYELIHVHTLFSYCSNVAAWVAQRKGIPYIIRPLGVLNRWGMNNRRPLLKRLSFAILERRLLSRAAFVHYTAEQERVEASALGFPHKAVIIPNPVEMSDAPRSDFQGRFTARHPQLIGQRIILFLSRIDRKKGLDLLIPAFRQVVSQYPDAVLVIAGNGSPALIMGLQRQVYECGIAGSVCWPGFLTGKDKLAAMADADIFVLPSYSENFGIAVVEAMALGVPVVISDQVGLHREVAEAHAGLVVKAAVEPLAAAIVHLLSADASRATLGQNGVALARSHFDVGVVIDKLVEEYGAVLGADIAPIAAHTIDSGPMTKDEYGRP